MPMVSGQVDPGNMQGTMVTSGGLEYTNGSKKVVIRGYRLTHTAHGARLTAVVNGHRILIATMVRTKVKTSGKTGTMTGGLKLSAAWAHRINHLVGKRVVHPGEDIGSLAPRSRWRSARWRLTRRLQPNVKSKALTPGGSCTVNVNCWAAGNEISV